MKRTSYSIFPRIIIFLILFLVFLPYHVCAFKLFNQTPKPEYFGIYIVDKDNLIELEKSKLGANANLLSALVGLEEPPELQIETDEFYLIYYSNDIPYSSVYLSKLEYKTSAQIENFTGKQKVDMNMWVQEKKIPLKVAPIKGEEDMYRLVPNESLNNGVYAVHYGILDNQATLEIAKKNDSVYGFLIGEPEGYVKKYNEILKPYVSIIKENKLKKTRSELVFNKELNKLKEVDYKNGKIYRTSIYKYNINNGMLMLMILYDQNNKKMNEEIYNYSVDFLKAEYKFIRKNRLNHKEDLTFNEKGNLILRNIDLKDYKLNHKLEYDINDMISKETIIQDSYKGVYHYKYDSSNRLIEISLCQKENDECEIKKIEYDDKNRLSKSFTFLNDKIIGNRVFFYNDKQIIYKKLKENKIQEENIITYSENIRKDELINLICNLFFKVSWN